jgi:hypothetical protein
MSETPSEPKRISFFFVVVVSALLILSFISLYMAVETYRNTGEPPDFMTIILIVGAMALSSYMILQMRRKPLKLGFEMPKVFTTVQCSSCDFKNVRDFQKGDYILKEADSCPECKNQTYISSIYREAEEKEE